MKKKIIAASLCIIAAGVVFAQGVYASECGQDFADDFANEQAVVAFWRKKDKEPAPEETPAVPTHEQQDQEQEAPKDDAQPTSGGSFVRYYRNNNFNQTQDYAPNQGGGNIPGIIDTNSINNGMTPDYRSTEYVPGINEQIEKILASQPAIKLDPNAYIVQHGDALWLVMGNIRAKVDILIYVDSNYMEPQMPHNRGNTLPIYK
jgi:hypothetical protein